MASRSFYRVVDKDDNDFSAGFETARFEEAREFAQRVGCKVVEDTYEWDDTTDVEGCDYTEVEDGEYSHVEVQPMDTHGEGTKEMLRCRECDEPLGEWHKYDCPVATYEYKAGEWVQDARWGTAVEDSGYQFGRVYTIGFGSHYFSGEDSHEPMEVELYPGAALVDGWPHVWTVEDPSHVRPFSPTPEQVAEYEARKEAH